MDSTEWKVPFKACIGYVSSGCGCGDPRCASQLYGFVVEKEGSFVGFVGCPEEGAWLRSEAFDERQEAYKSCMEILSSAAAVRETQVVVMQ